MGTKFMRYSCACLLLMASPASGQSPQHDVNSPVGHWKTVDDTTGQVTSLVVIWEDNGKLYGKIEQLIHPDPHDRNPRCLRCDGDARDKPLVGLRILWDLRRDGDHWSGGRVLDPDNGKEYRCSLALESGGRKLKVRGYLGFSLLGRTQYWLRDD